MTGATPQGPPPSSTSRSERLRSGDELLGTEESLSRGSAMDTTRPSPAGVGSASASAAPVDVVPPVAPGSGARVGDTIPDPEEGDEDIPIPRRAGPALLLPPRPRGPVLPQLWQVPKTIGEFPDGHLKEVYRRVPAARRDDVWQRRTRRFPRQVALPAGVMCDLPALLHAADANEVSALAHSLAQAPGELEFDDTTMTVLPEWCFLPRPFVGGADAHEYHGVVRDEHRHRTKTDFLVHSSRVEFPLVPAEERDSFYPRLPDWWESMEVPCGFPARVPLLVAYFGTFLSGAGGHRAFAILATHWVVEVARGWYSDVVHRGYLWHLSPSLVEAISGLGLPWLCMDAAPQAESVLRAMCYLHNQLDWENLTPFLSRNKRIEPGAESSPTRGFVYCTRTLVQGALLLREGLGDATLPYADGVHPSSSPPLSGQVAAGVTSRRPPPKGVTRTRGNAQGSGSGRRTSSATPPQGPGVVVPFEFIEPFPESEVAAVWGRTRVPRPLARGVAGMLPNLGALMYDTTLEASLVASLDTLAWVTRRVSGFLAQPDNSSQARQALAAEVTRLAVGHEFVQRLLTTQQHMVRHGGSSSGPATYEPEGSGSRPPPPFPGDRVFSPPYPSYDHGGSWSGPPRGGGSGHMSQ